MRWVVLFTMAPHGGGKKYCWQRVAFIWLIITSSLAWRKWGEWEGAFWVKRLTVYSWKPLAVFPFELIQYLYVWFLWRKEPIPWLHTLPAYFKDGLGNKQTSLPDSTLSYKTDIETELLLIYPLTDEYGGVFSLF